MKSIAAAFLFTASQVLAQQAAPATMPKPIVLRAAHLFDGNSDSIIRNGVVVVQGNRIVAAGANVDIPADAQVIDLGDATLLPGLIDSHVHLTEENAQNYYLNYFQTLMRHPAEQAILATTFARKTIDAGFTTVRNLGASDYVDVGLRNGINNGWAVGPRMLVAIHAIGATGGHGDSDPIPPSKGFPSLGPIDGVCNGPAECRAAVRYQIKYGADVIKFMPSGGVLSLSDPVDAPELSQDEMNAIVEESHHWGRKVAAHCHGDAAAKMAVIAGVDSIEHGSFLKPDTLTSMRDKGIYLVPTLLASDWIGGRLETFPPAIANKARAAIAARSEMFRNALKIGVKIAFGTDSAVSPHGLNAREFALMTGLGMSPAAALRSATTVAASLLGVDDRGVLAAGKLADIVAVPGNPLDDIKVMERIAFVMKDGVVVKGK
ncbi:MAG: amidohydrolase family protein [Acidobacteria bacterium]|nr:amidohydrolase family protein [Acidobacteriota bacterium]MBV9071506.1 amidohydrolase family protein [Acidobacteriota bacterium]